MFLPSPGDTSAKNTNVVGASSSQFVADDAISSSVERSLNPQYEAWIAVDQLLLGWLYNSMAPDVVVQLMGFENVKELWEAIEELFGVQSRAEEDYLRQVFQQTRKGNMKMSEYLRVMKTRSDNLAQAGSPVTTRALVSQILLGLNEEYNLVVVRIQGKPIISWLDMQLKLLSYEKRLEHLNSVKTKSNFTQTPSINVVINRNSNGSKPHNNQKQQ